MDKITWQAPEFIKHDKSSSWFVALWIISAGLVVVAFLTKSILMGVLVFIATLVVSVYAAKEPRNIKIVLDERKINFGKESKSLDNFSSFWIFEKGSYNILSLSSKKMLQPHIKIILPEELSKDVRMILRSSLEEREQEESFIEGLSEWLKF